MWRMHQAADRCSLLRPHWPSLSKNLKTTGHFILEYVPAACRMAPWLTAELGCEPCQQQGSGAYSSKLVSEATSRQASVSSLILSQ